MSNLEIFQNGVSLHPDTMGEAIYQIGRKNADGDYDAVVFDPMSKSEAKAVLAKMEPKKAKQAAKKKIKRTG
jgi:hypothetical protein